MTPAPAPQGDGGAETGPGPGGAGWATGGSAVDAAVNSLLLVQPDPGPGDGRPAEPTAPLPDVVWVRAPAPPQRPALQPRRVAVVTVAWLLVTLACAGIVAYLLGPLSHNRQQRLLLEDFRQELEQGAGESLFSESNAPTAFVEPGQPLAILQIERLRLQQVVLEGVAPSQTQAGPGHVPGTGGLGQPGNAAVVGRRQAFGGPFRELDRLQEGDPIVVTTAQGSSLYEVRAVERTDDLDAAYEATDDDRLTLVSSDEPAPWSAGGALVVTADLQGRPFVPAPQGSRSVAQDGRHGEPAAWGWLIVYLVLFAAAAGVATVLYRRWLSLSTYLLTTPVMVAFAVLATEAGSRLLPAWF